jgi:hypothetical protein
LNWLVEQCIRNEGYWVFASLLSTCIFLFDERSWSGIAKSGYKFELQRYRLQIFFLTLIHAGLALAASQMPAFIGRLAVTAVSVVALHAFQKLVRDFGGINLTGASKRILLVLSIALTTFAMMPFILTTFVPLIFVVAGASSSLSSRNHLFFKLSQETIGLRHRLSSDQASRHNRHLLAPVTSYPDSSDDIAPKAG